MVTFPRPSRLEAKRYALRLQGRWRALGNIQFVGQLYKKRMLTEKIMHECMKALLEDVSLLQLSQTCQSFQAKHIMCPFKIAQSVQIGPELVITGCTE